MGKGPLPSCPALFTVLHLSTSIPTLNLHTTLKRKKDRDERTIYHLPYTKKKAKEKREDEK